MATEIACATDLFALVDDGRLLHTIRKGRRDYPLGPGYLTDSADEQRNIDITSVRYCRFRNLTTADAQANGFADLPELRAVFERFYPGFDDDEEVTVIAFDVVR